MILHHGFRCSRVEIGAQTHNSHDATLNLGLSSSYATEDIQVGHSQPILLVIYGWVQDVSLRSNGTPTKPPKRADAVRPAGVAKILEPRICLSHRFVASTRIPREGAPVHVCVNRCETENFIGKPTGTSPSWGWLFLIGRQPLGQLTHYPSD